MRFAPILAALTFLSLGTAAAAKVQPFTAGWDNFNEPLNYANSNVKWSYSPKTKALSVTFNLVGATPSKAYQTSIVIFCTTEPPNFGRFPVASGSPGSCQSITRQGVTAQSVAAEVGAIVTDSSGNGSMTVSTGALPMGTFKVEFTVRDGVGCNLTGGNASACNLDFQSPGPFDTTSHFTVH
jgi:hypothetical protein